MSARFERERADARVRRPLRRVVHVVLRQATRARSRMASASHSLSLLGVTRLTGSEAQPKRPI